MRIKTTWRIVYVIVLLVVVVWQGITIHQLQVQLKPIKWYVETHNADQLTIKKMLIAVGGLSY